MVCNNDFTEWKGEKMGPERNLTLEVIKIKLI